MKPKKKKPLTPRHKAREVAFQVLYRYDVAKKATGAAAPAGPALAKELEGHFEHFDVSDEARSFAAELVSGTLAHRFVGTPAQGNLRAKTGYLSDVRSLAGTLRTAGSRDVVFAVVVNGPGAEASVDALDALLATLAADPS